MGRAVVRLVLFVVFCMCFWVSMTLYQKFHDPLVPSSISLDFLGEQNRTESFVVPSDNRSSGGEIYFVRFDVTLQTLSKLAHCKEGFFDGRNQLFFLDCLWSEDKRFVRAAVPVVVSGGDVSDWQIERDSLTLQPVAKTWIEVNNITLVNLLFTGMLTALTGLCLLFVMWPDRKTPKILM